MTKGKIYKFIQLLKAWNLSEKEIGILKSKVNFDFNINLEAVGFSKIDEIRQMAWVLFGHPIGEYGTVKIGGSVDNPETYVWYEVREKDLKDRKGNKATINLSKCRKCSMSF